VRRGKGRERRGARQEECAQATGVFVNASWCTGFVADVLRCVLTVLCCVCRRRARGAISPINSLFRRLVRTQSRRCPEHVAMTRRIDAPAIKRVRMHVTDEN
jgi:hypothetical protein